MFRSYWSLLWLVSRRTRQFSIYSPDFYGRGLTRKVLILLLIGIAHCLDVYLLKNGSTIRTATIFFYISNEGISLLENTSRLGLPVPDKLKNVLQQLHNKDGDK